MNCHLGKPTIKFGDEEIKKGNLGNAFFALAFSTPVYKLDLPPYLPTVQGNKLSFASEPQGLALGPQMVSLRVILAGTILASCADF